MKILVTGTAGFIGFHLANRLLADGYHVVGVDCINAYYDINLKYNRLAFAGINKDNIEYGKPVKSSKYENYIFYQVKLDDKPAFEEIYKNILPDVVINLAAQAGVSHSLVHPEDYVSNNITGFLNVLECCRYHGVKHLLYASSSSVYGINDETPFSTAQNTDHPASMYAASKRSNELMAHVYSHLFKIPTTGLRFFNAYGTWGRPDMALYIFTSKILKDEPIPVHNNGEMYRDFTYVDDIVEGIVRIMKKIPESDNAWKASTGDPASSSAPYKLYNIGNSTPVYLMRYIELIEENLGKKAEKKFIPTQPGEVIINYADTTPLIEEIDYKPVTKVEDGVKKFVDWFKQYHNIE